MMDRRVLGIAVLWGLVLGALVLPARADEDKHKRAMPGKVLRVEESVLVMNPDWGQEHGKEVFVATDATTKVTLDNKPATLGDLKAGMAATVLQVDGLTVEIQGRTIKGK